MTDVECYDCARKGQAVSAVAVCMRCGAGVCLEHAHETPVEVRRAASPGQSEMPDPARHITCPVCFHAEGLDHEP
ncbi:DUF2180 family protein [Nocardiopsis sp. EMB25]|uniref:DUF2180 family protein n=1 Tax=Nocardiopsis sp. EMB25 TaxID=2835867 RepID=UPI002284CEFA|nr:DUF2180 family protein [Nocardiopsis sp. EMB25]MCY9784138.1 DUF2180 family protein [Nocardiopsis sp. EMB25]